jgi:hypothetical protein
MVSALRLGLNAAAIKSGGRPPPTTLP